MRLNDKEIKLVDKIEKERNFDFSKNTTYGCGGKAKLAYFPKTVRQAQLIYDYLDGLGEKFIVLGNGSNVLAADGYFNGSVIVTKDLRGVSRTGKCTIFCKSGTLVSSLIKYCVSNGLSGLEYLSGIPATFGGILYMNGGAGGTFISQNVQSVTCYDGETKILSNNECNFGYKHSTMRDIKCLILGAQLIVEPQDSTIVKGKVESFLSKRSNQPKGKSCGCVFKNYMGISAGKIIQDASLSGLKIGNAYVSPQHSNFIINGGGSSSDVYRLIREVKRRVLEKFSIMLEEEVVYIGEFNDFNG